MLMMARSRYCRQHAPLLPQIRLASNLACPRGAVPDEPPLIDALGQQAIGDLDTHTHMHADKHTPIRAHNRSGIAVQKELGPPSQEII